MKSVVAYTQGLGFKLRTEGGHKKIAKEMDSPKRHSIFRDMFGNKSQSKADTKKAVKTLKGS